MKNYYQYPLICISFFTTLLVTVNAQEPVIAVPDFQVNDNAGSSNQSYADVAADNDGNFICVWEDQRNEGGYLEGMFGQPGGDIFAQRLDPDGNPIGNNFKVNVDASLKWQTLPVIAAAGNGSFIVAWLDMRESTYQNESQQIYAQRFDKDGHPQGNNFKVNEADGVAWMEKPAIAADNEGNFVIAWSGESNKVAPYEIYAQRYLADGTPIGGNFIVSSYANRNEPRYPSIAMKGSGEFVIAFEGTSMSDQHPDIYVQRFASDGAPLDSNIVVNVQTGEDALVTAPLAGIDDSGNFLVTWIDARLGYYQTSMFGQWFNSNGTHNGKNFNLCEAGIYLNPSESGADLSVEADGSFCTIWFDWTTNRISARRFSGDSTATGSQFALSEINMGTNPAGIVNNDGKILAVWTGTEIYHGNSPSQSDIIGQLVEGDSTRLVQPLRIDDDTESGQQVHSEVVADQTGNFTVVWEDHRDDEGDIYLQHFFADGSRQGLPVKLNTDESGNKNTNPVIAIDSSGIMLVVWEDYQSAKLVGQFISGEGLPVDSNFIVNSGNEYRYLQPDLANVGNNTFIITWHTSYSIGAQVYSLESGPVGPEIIVNNVSGDFKVRDHPAVAADDSGRFIIVWKDQRTGSDIYAQRYDQGGQPIGENIKVTSESNWGIEPSVACKPDGTSYIVWTGQGITFQKLDADGNMVGANVQLTDAPTAENYPMKPDISIDSQGQMVITWEIGDLTNTLSSGIYGLRISSGGTAIDSVFSISGNGMIHPTDLRTYFTNNRIYSTWSDNLYVNTNWDVFANVLFFEEPNTIESDIELNILANFKLYQNYPNPFNPETSIKYSLSGNENITVNVKLEVFDLVGRKVRTLVNKLQRPGTYIVFWDGRDDRGIAVSSGMYLYSVRTGSHRISKKMLLVR